MYVDEVECESLIGTSVRVTLITAVTTLVLNRETCVRSWQASGYKKWLMSFVHHKRVTRPSCKSDAQRKDGMSQLNGVMIGRGAREESLSLILPGYTACVCMRCHHAGVINCPVCRTEPVLPFRRGHTQQSMHQSFTDAAKCV